MDFSKAAAHYRLRHITCTAAVLFAAAVLVEGPTRAQQDVLGTPRAGAPLTLLQLNDVYSTLPVDGAGGLARVATLKRQLAAAGRTPLLLLSGDFLSSSVASTVFKGEQMIATLNAAGLDIASLGNHEFDFGLDVLLRRMSEARFQWVVSNVIDRRTGKPVGGAPPYIVRTFGPLVVGFLGLCVSAEELTRDKLKEIEVLSAMDTAAKYIPELQRAGADVIVALTHLTYAEDRALAERFPEIDVIIGGHEHFPIAASVNRTLISKAGSDAKFVARIDVSRPRRDAGNRLGPVERFYELVPITSALEDDVETARVVASYESRLGAELDKTASSTRVPLDGVAARLRSSETNLGNLVADAIRASAGSDLALVNAGGIRGDRSHGPGPLTLRTLIEMLPFGNVVVTLAVPGRVVVDALNHGVARLPAAAGQFPQVSGLTFRVDAGARPGDRIRDVKVQGTPLDANRTYTLAIPDFLLQGGDGYALFASANVVVGPESGELMVTALEKMVSGREIAPATDGRIQIAR